MLQRRASTAAAALIAFIVLVPLHAQQDFVISPAGTAGTTLPLDARIQGGAFIGSAGFIAFGTARLTSGGMLIPSLAYSVLNDTARVMEAGMLHSDEARPFGFVGVTAAGDNFIVVWNDRRTSAPGIYMRRFDTAGHALEDEVRISEGSIAPSSDLAMEAYGFRMAGRLLVWNDVRSGGTGVYGIHLGPDGHVDGTEMYLGSRLHQISPVNLGCGVLLQLDGNLLHIIDATGHLDPRPIPASRLGEGYFIDADESLVRLKGGFVEFFRSLFDSLPVHRVPTGSYVHSGPCICKIGNGQYRIVSARDVLDATGMGIETSSLLVDTTHIVRNDTVRFDHFNGITPPRSGYSMFDSPTYIRTAGCGGSYTLAAGIINRWGSGSEGDHINTSNWKISIGQTGEVSLGGSLNLGCIEGWRLPVSRDSSVAVSAVRVYTHSVDVMLKRPIPRGIPFPVRGHPCAAWHAARLVVAWADYATDSTAVLAFIDGNHVAGIRTAAARVQPRDRARIDGMVDCSYARTSVSRDPFSPPDKPDRWTPQCCVVRATDTGWAIRTLEFEPTYASLYLRERGVGYDPNTGRMVYVLDEFIAGAFYSDPYVVTVDTAGVQRSFGRPKVLLQRNGCAVVPLDSEMVLLANDSMGIRCIGSRIVDSVALAPSNGEAYYRRLLGGRFLRMLIHDRTAAQTDTKLTVQLYDLDARLLADTTIVLDGPRYDPSAVERPGDSMLVVFTGGAGLHAVAFTRDLHLVHSDRQVGSTAAVSRAPSAASHGDSLLVVWREEDPEDIRIVGRYLAFADAVAEVPADMQSAAALQLVPNPAHGMVTAIIRGAVVFGRLELCDMRGAIVRSLNVAEAGTAGAGIAIDLTGLPGGVYAVRLHASGITRFARLEVLD